MLNFGFSLGRPSGTPPLLQGDYIWYSLDPDTGFLNNGGLRYINDEGSTVMVGASGQYDGIMHSGRSVTVSGDGVIPVPINATFEDHTPTGFVGMDNADEVATVVDSSSTGVRCDITVAGTNINRPRFLFDIPQYSNDSLNTLLEFEVISHSGAFRIRQAYAMPSNTKIIFDTAASGKYTIPTTAFKAGDDQLFLYLDGTIIGDTEYKNVSIKEIQQVQGSVTFFNNDTGAFEQVGADGIGSKELVVNGDFSDGTTGFRNARCTMTNDNNRLKIVTDSGVADGYFTQDYGFEFDLPNKDALISFDFEGNLGTMVPHDLSDNQYNHQYFSGTNSYL